MLKSVGEGNRGPDAAGMPAPVDMPKTLVEAAYQRLRRDIIEGRLMPGERLRVEHLKDHYEVGAGTLREALGLLVADTLVVAQGQRGFSVAPISLADLEDLTATRVLLECEAVRQSIAHGDEAWEAELIGAFHRLSRAEERLKSDPEGAFAEWEQRNRAFHSVLLSGSPSRWLGHFLAILYQQSERYRRLSVVTHMPRDVHAEHTAIFEAALRRDADAAAALLRTHITLTLEALRLEPPPGLVNRPA